MSLCRLSDDNFNCDLYLIRIATKEVLYDCVGCKLIRPIELQWKDLTPHINLHKVAKDTVPIWLDKKIKQELLEWEDFGLLGQVRYYLWERPRDIWQRNTQKK